MRIFLFCLWWKESKEIHIQEEEGKKKQQENHQHETRNRLVGERSKALCTFSKVILMRNDLRWVSWLL